jgi:hypothetical protein
MKTSIKQILFLCVFFFAAALIVSCGAKRHPESPGGDSQNVVAETPSKKKQSQKPSHELTRQKERQASVELDEETDETQPSKPGTPGSDVQEKTTRRESENSSVTSPARSDFTTTLPPLTEEQKAEGWIDTTGECYQGPNMTTEEAQRRALEKTERNAIEQALGVEISAQTLQLRSETQQDFHESFTELSKATVYGKIIDRKELWAPVENGQVSQGERPIPLYRVTLRAKVAKEHGKPDPSFQVTLKLNDGKLIFREGDEMILHITPTKDCYITVFNVLSDNTVLVLFPHMQQMAPGRKTLLIPSEAERQQGVHPRVGLLPGKTRDTEYVWVVATKDDIPFLPREMKEFSLDIAILSGKVMLPTYQSALEEINLWLVSIPLDQRAFDVQQYEIRRK